MAATTLRLPEDLHQLVRVAAGLQGKSDAAWMLGAIRAQLLRDAASKRGRPLAGMLEGRVLEAER